MNNFKLCYIQDNFAYFTTQDLDKQCGDDWDDAPYEHNAGTPYSPCWHRQSEEKKNCQCDVCLRDYNEDGSPKWQIVKIAFDGDFSSPKDTCETSVEEINNKLHPWLWAGFPKDGIESKIFAGVSFYEFDKFIRNNGGNIYESNERLKQILESDYHTKKELNRTLHVADLEALAKKHRRETKIMQEKAEIFNAQLEREVEEIAKRLRIWFNSHKYRKENKLI
ncbi:MAG: hypothetical protein AABY22_04600 [Nanoarchaeota archaeon]